jgi:hypothetical protein
MILDSNFSTSADAYSCFSSSVSFPDLGLNLSLFRFYLARRKVNDTKDCDIYTGTDHAHRKASCSLEENFLNSYLYWGLVFTIFIGGSSNKSSLESNDESPLGNA